jgi:hypothetical protein
LPRKDRCVSQSDTAHQGAVRNGGGIHAGQGSRAVDQPALEGPVPLAVITAHSGIDGKDDDMTAIEAGIKGAQIGQATRE